MNSLANSIHVETITPRKTEMEFFVAQPSKSAWIPEEQWTKWERISTLLPKASGCPVGPADPQHLLLPLQKKKKNRHRYRYRYTHTRWTTRAGMSSLYHHAFVHFLSLSVFSPSQVLLFPSAALGAPSVWFLEFISTYLRLFWMWSVPVWGSI